MRWKVILGIVKMNKSPVNIRNLAFQHVLQALADVMTIVQARLAVEHNIYFDVQPVTRVVCFEVLDEAYTFGEAHDNI